MVRAAMPPPARKKKAATKCGYNFKTKSPAKLRFKKFTNEVWVQLVRLLLGRKANVMVLDAKDGLSSRALLRDRHPASRIYAVSNAAGNFTTRAWRRLRAAGVRSKETDAECFLREHASTLGGAYVDLCYSLGTKVVQQLRPLLDSGRPRLLFGVTLYNRGNSSSGLAVQNFNEVRMEALKAGFGLLAPLVFHHAAAVTFFFARGIEPEKLETAAASCLAADASAYRLSDAHQPSGRKILLQELERQQRERATARRVLLVHERLTPYMERHAHMPPVKQQTVGNGRWEAVKDVIPTLPPAIQEALLAYWDARDRPWLRSRLTKSVRKSRENEEGAVERSRRHRQRLRAVRSEVKRTKVQLVLLKACRNEAGLERELLRLAIRLRTCRTAVVLQRADHGTFFVRTLLTLVRHMQQWGFTELATTAEDRNLPAVVTRWERRR
jgi:hypothetical protein